MNFIKKITSRKFILALTAVVSGIATAIAGGGDEISTIVGSAMTIIATVVYCIIEGVVDAKSIARIADAAADISEELGELSSNVSKEDIASAAEVLIGSGGDDTVEGE